MSGLAIAKIVDAVILLILAYPSLKAKVQQRFDAIDQANAEGRDITFDELKMDQDEIHALDDEIQAA